MKEFKPLIIPADSAWDRPLKWFQIFRKLRITSRKNLGNDNMFETYLFEPYFNILKGVQNIYKWLPILWKDRDWDYTYIYEVLQFKLDNTREYIIKSNRFVSCDTVNRDMTLALNLIERVKNNYYEEEYLQYVSSEWVDASPYTKEQIENLKGFLNEVEIADLIDNGDKEIIFNPYNIDAYFFKYRLGYKKMQNLYPDIIDKMYLANKLAQHNQIKANRILYTLLKNRMSEWWD